jgi:hypothetical protein
MRDVICAVELGAVGEAMNPRQLSRPFVEQQATELGRRASFALDHVVDVKAYVRASRTKPG